MRFIGYTIVLLCTSGCMDQDPFGLALRRVDGPYRLEQFESGKYYLQKDGANQDGGGYIDGVVVQIGWTNGHIFAKRHANFPSDRDGWMVIEVRTGKTVGPLSENDFNKRFPAVQTFAPEEAWKRLKSRRGQRQSTPK